MSQFVHFENGVKITLDKRFIEFLSDSRIFSHPNIQVQRWQPNDSMCFLPSTEMEPYSGVFRGQYMNPLGAFSFITLPVIGKYQMQFATGRYCSIGGGLRIAGNDHPTSSLSSSPTFYDPEKSWVKAYDLDIGITGEAPVNRPAAKGVPIVGHDVWFGGDVMLNQSVRIGHGAVVAANSHVTKDVPDYAIVGGNPARLIRYRFPQEVIQELLDIRFWRFSKKDLLQFNLQNIEQFIKEYRAAEHQLKEWVPPKIHLWNSWKEISGGS
jgi:acetyltransferase-like isoleucine patch superfamily enzyme